MAVGRVCGFSIATRCATVDELIAKYRDRVDELSILVNAVESREIGTECGFAMLLTDKTVALAGTCIVMNVFTDTKNPFKRTGMRLGIQRVRPDTETVWRQLLALRVPSRAVAMRAESTAYEVTGTTAQRYVPRAQFILPANPLMNVTDASLEGFVENKLDAAAGVTPPAAFPYGTQEEVVGAVPLHVDHALSEPLPLPPPPTARASQVMSVEAYRASALPALAVGATDDTGPIVYTHTPPASRRAGVVLALVVFLVPLLGAAAVIGYMQLIALRQVPALVMLPAETAVLDEPVQEHARVEPAPVAPIEPEPEPALPEPEEPATRQPIHAVLVKSYPNAARVTVDGRYFGTTPTYVKVPANTEVEIEIVRRGYKAVTYPLVSKKRTDRVVVWLQRARGGKR